MSNRIRGSIWLALVTGLMAAPFRAPAQTILQAPAQVFAVPLGTSALLVTPTNIQRWAVGEPLVAEVVELSPNELIINGKKLGTTTLIVWQTGQAPRVYSVEVTVDTPALERYLRAALPGEEIQVSASGNSVTLSGTVKDPNSVDRAVEIARGTGVAAVINNLVAPPAVQVLLRVRVAEVNRSALKDFATAFATLNPQNLDSDGDWSGSTISDGIIDFLLSNPNANLSAVISAAISRGNFRSLAEPNLLTLPGREASFLAGGEFPYPTVQGGTQFGQAITITFREFGVRLRFTPTITRSGSIRLKVAPEVSSLDFANGITLQGFEVPSILTRRAETEVELREGQYLALAGLIDNSTLENVTKIPILGDIPILGEFFKSRSARQRQTELLVLITPKLITASETPPAIPTGEPETWRWPGWMRRALQDQVPIPPPGP